MNNCFINSDLLKNTLFEELESKDKNYDYYLQAKTELGEQFNLEDVLAILDNSKLTDDYEKLMKDFDTNILYKSYIHGTNHNIRVCFFAYVIASNDGISSKDFSLIMEAAKYHDIGRENDSKDNLHGKRSADMLSFLENKYSYEELNYLRTIITCHSIDDSEFEEIAFSSGIQDTQRCKRMYNVLKDADGLDRVRLKYPYIKVDYLRCDTSKRMVLFAYELFNNYDKLIR